MRFDVCSIEDAAVDPLLISACKTLERLFPDKEFHLYDIYKIGTVEYPKYTKATLIK